MSTVQKTKKKIFDFKNIKGDLFGGLTAGVVALPLALAFGVQSGMGAIAGLYGAMILGFFAALFGGTPTQVSGPTGPMTVVSAGVITMAISVTGNMEDGMGIIIGSFLMAGLFQIIMSFLHVGKFVKFIPYPVLSGFMTGIGVIIILFQIFPFMGLKSPGTTIDIVKSLDDAFLNMNLEAFLLSAATVITIYLFPKITKSIPSPLVALILGTLTCAFFNFDVPLIGDIPKGMPEIKLGSLLTLDVDHYGIILQFGIMLASLGAIDSLLTSVIADNVTKTKHNSNRELLGQGIGNMLAALIGGLPGAGATMRTVVNINSGGRTKISGMVHGIFLAIILFWIGDYAEFIPLGVLSGILMTVGIGIVDYKGLKHILKVPKTDAVILIVVLIITVFGNLLNAVGVGVLMACVLFMKKSADMAESMSNVSEMESFSINEPWEDEKSIYSQYRGKIYIKHLSGPLFFGFTTRFQELVNQIDKNVKVLIIRMKDVPTVDQSGLYAMEEAILALEQRGVVVVISGLQDQPLDMMKKIDIIPDLVPESHLFPTFGVCKMWLKENLSGDGDGLEKIAQNLLEIKKAQVKYRM